MMCTRLDSPVLLNEEAETGVTATDESAAGASLSFKLSQSQPDPRRGPFSSGGSKNTMSETKPFEILLAEYHPPMLRFSRNHSLV
jgi:hypothetical protein